MSRPWRRIFITGVLFVGAVLLACRLALPTVVQNYVNDKLDELPEYEGQVGDVDIHLLRGAYSIQNVNILKTTGAAPVPFVKARKIDLSVQWRELWHGAVVGEIHVDQASLNFVKAETEEKSQTSIDDSWLQVVQDLFPFRINRFEIRNSAVWFHDIGTEPKVDLFLTNLFAICTNLYNTRDFATELPADFRAEGITLGGGELNLHVRLDPLGTEPKFDLELAVENMDLPALNELLEAYGRFNVKRGTFHLFAEIAGSQGNFDGYIKPFFQDLDVFELEQDAENPVKLAWQAIVAGAMKIFKNQPEDHVATRIPISGSFEQTQMRIPVAILNVLRNAFVQAFQQRVDDSIDLFDRSTDEETRNET